jgi:hypothetical protein
MAEFAYTTVPGKIKTLLGKIRQTGVPTKVTMQWLKTLGFTSSNDQSLISVLKFVGLTDSSGVPTSVWTNYRGANNRSVLGKAIRTGYSELFSVYPDAYQRSQSDLDHVFSTTSTGGKQVIGKTISTFKALVEEADFSESHDQNAENASKSPASTQGANAATASRSASMGISPNLHIDVQVHISPESSPEQIDQIFASMAKHLYGEKKSD